MKWNEMGDDLAHNLTKRKIIWFGQLSLFRSSWNLCWYLIYHLYDKKLFSTQVLSTAQGPVQHSHAMTSAQSQLICGGEEVYPTLEMYLHYFKKLHLIHLHVKQIHSSLSEFLMNKLLFTIYSNPFFKSGILYCSTASPTVSNQVWKRWGISNVWTRISSQI